MLPVVCGCTCLRAARTYTFAGPAADADPPGTTGGSAVLVAGCVLVAWTLVAAVLIRLHPEANALDRWGASLVPADPHSAFDLKVAGVRTVVLAGGSVLAAVVAVGRDRWRALACLLGQVGRLTPVAQVGRADGAHLAIVERLERPSRRWVATALAERGAARNREVGGGRGRRHLVFRKIQ